MIRPQFLNLSNSSFLLFLEHFILERGEGYSVVTGKYNYIGRGPNNYYTYASAVQPLVYDESITSPLSGIYVNGTFYRPGQGNFINLDQKNNRAYFNASVTNVSGIFPLNDINILPLDISEEKLLFETKFVLRNQSNNITSTGYSLKDNEKTYPCIYYKEQNNSNSAFSFGGEQISDVNIGLFLICESNYQLSALKSIIGDIKEEYFPMFSADKFPFDYLGGIKNTGVNFNYNILKTGYLAVNSGLYVKDSTVNTFNRTENADFNKLNPTVYSAVADITFCKTRFSRSTTNNL